MSSFALCARAYAGLIRARARLFLAGDEKREWADVPKEFWWATGHAALEQDWKSGDFSTWIEQRHHLQAFGVTFALSDVLEMVEFTQRPIIARQLSVANDTDWMTTRAAIQSIVSASIVEAHKAEKFLTEQGRLGFVVARAVQADGIYGDRPEGERHWDAREWDVPVWVWEMIAGAEELFDDWDVGKFTTRGRASNGLTLLMLSGVHLLRGSIEVLTGPQTPASRNDAKRGRRPTYDWATATAAVWGKIFRSELTPEVQADIEKALIDVLAVGDKSPSPSTVRPFAKPIWEEFQKP